MANVNIPTQKLMVSRDTNVAIGCIVTGGFADDLNSEVRVTDIEASGNVLIVTINQVAFGYTRDKVNNTYTVNMPQSVQVDGNHYMSRGVTFTCTESSFGADNLFPTNVINPKTVSFKENVKGWVSFKSFTPENAISMANDYYTFFNGKLFLHHVEDVDRNTFYSDVLDPDNLGLAFTPSSVDVVLNDSVSAIKEFKTLNYEGSQSKVNKFTSKIVSIPLQNSKTYNDQEYYNLAQKRGWSVESIITNDEDGYIDELLEKEGKWFNNIKRKIDLGLNKADTSDFSFQGIARLSSVEGVAVGVSYNCYSCRYNELVTLFPEDSAEPITCPEGWSDIEPICGDDGDNGLEPSIIIPT